VFLPGVGVGARGFAGAGYGEGFGNVETKGGGVAIGRIVSEREPAGREKEEGAVAIDGRGANARDGTVFLVGERTGVSER